MSVSSTTTILFAACLLIARTNSSVDPDIHHGFSPTQRTRQSSDRLNITDRSIETLQEFYSGNIRCRRYCLRDVDNRGKDGGSQFLDLLWELDRNVNREGESSETILIPKVFLNGYENGKIYLSEGNCENFLLSGCEIAENSGNLNKKETFSPQNTQLILTQTEELLGNSEIKYRIEKNLSSMCINILGNVSKINLQLPVEWVEATRALDVMLSVSRVRNVMVVRLNIHNPRRGEWRLKLSADENSKYRLTLTTFQEEFRSNIRNAKSLRSKRVLSENPLSVDTPKTQASNNKRIRFDDQNLSDMMKIGFETTMVIEEKIRDNETVKPLDDSNLTTRLDLSERRSESLEFDELEDNRIRKNIIVNLLPSTKLVAESNSNVAQPVTFEVTNNFPFGVVIVFSAYSPIFRIYPFDQNRYVLSPGQKVTVTLNVGIPFGTGIKSGIITLSANVINPVQIMEQKSVYLFVQNPDTQFTDDVKPTLRYYFNNNCNGKNNGEVCSKNYWSVDVEAEDFQSGLKVVTSSPTGLRPVTEFVSGTKGVQKFYYTANCCNPVVEITAIDVLDNRVSRIIDVREWYNLSTGEILAIVLGAILILLLIIIIIWRIVHVVHKKSLQLPYTQRYATRSTRRDEGSTI